MILGIDEASKVPVLGSLYICGALIDNIKKLYGKGITDSKLLPEKKREKLAKIIKKLCKVKMLELTPQKIDQKDGYNLNDKEMIEILKLIKHFSKCHKLDRIIIDCFDHSPEHFMDRMRKIRDKQFPLLQLEKYNIIALHRADAKYKIVGAASILATLKASKNMKRLDKKYKIGSGNPGDPQTIEFLKQHLYELEKYPFIRKSWKTILKLKEIKNESNRI